jgi:ParB family chromosome partitioning protein
VSFAEKGASVDVTDIRIDLIDISDANTRKDLSDGQVDSTIEDLARSIERQGLLSPISVFATSDGRYSLVAGQRRMLAFKYLGIESVPAVVHPAMTDESATAVSLVENVHRADMNPRDKAVAFKHLVELLGSVQAASRETGVGESTIRKYVQLLALAPALQESLAAGETKNTQALAKLAQTFTDVDEQESVWERISGFRQDIQLDVIGRVESDLGNLDELVNQATEGGLGYRIVRNCPHDCPTIPIALKAKVAAMLSSA